MIKEETAKAVEQEKAKLKKVINKVYSLIKHIKDFVHERKFVEADKYYSEAVNSLIAEKLIDPKTYKQVGGGPYVELLLPRLNNVHALIMTQWGRTIEEEARKAFIAKKYDKAIILAKEAIEKSPGLEKELENFVELCNRSIDSDKFKKQTSLLAVDPENTIRKEDINILLKNAEILYNNQRYSQARDTIERIIVRDPYNLKATYLLDKIYKKLYKYAKLRRENEILERVAEVQWKWVEPVLPAEHIKPPPVGPKEATESKSGLYDKLQKIVFDQVVFDQATITSVLTHLNERSKQLDPDKTGVSLILHQDVKVADIARISMDFDDIPMGEVIRYLCQAAGLRYRVEQRAVIIGNENIDEMETRFFTVRAALVSSLTDEGEDGEEDDDMMEADADLMDAAEMDTEVAEREGMTSHATSEALKKYFGDRGVPFPEDATIAYDRRSGKLIVKNTPEKLRRLEGLLRDLDIQTPLVLIEAKLVEITQDDLEELGFDWVFSSTGNENGTWIIDATEKLLRSYGGGRIFSTSNVSNRADEYVHNLTLLPNFGPNKDRNLGLTINAIDRSGRGEVLSAPKVIATSGSTAIIRMVQEEYFPEMWTEPEVTVTETIITYTPAYPEFGDATDVGIRFEVTPTVSPNNYTISLTLNPQIIALTDWTTYDYSIVIRSIESDVGVKMPELSRRDLNTNVKVYDGETVVLGGTLRELNTQREDKIPGLGDVPLIGRFFRSNLSSSEKRNLLIFVTARLVSNDGVPVRSDALRGIPDFHR